MPVDVTDVRDYLNKMNKERIPDEVIVKQLAVALPIINDSCSASVDTKTKDMALTVYASYLSYQAYCTEYERTVGRVPDFMVGHLQIIADTANVYLRLISKGNPVYTCPAAQNISMESSLSTVSLSNL